MKTANEIQMLEHSSSPVEVCKMIANNTKRPDLIGKCIAIMSKLFLPNHRTYLMNG